MCNSECPKYVIFYSRFILFKFIILRFELLLNLVYTVQFLIYRFSAEVIILKHSGCALRNAVEDFVL